jgi:hypothetical protein
LYQKKLDGRYHNKTKVPLQGAWNENKLNDMPVAHDAGGMQYRLHSALPFVPGRLALSDAGPFQG